MLLQQWDVGLGAESAAIAAGLDFMAVTKERYDLIMLQETLDRPQVEKIVEVVQDEAFQKTLVSLPGYELSETGNTVTVKPRQE